MNANSTDVEDTRKLAYLKERFVTAKVFGRLSEGINERGRIGALPKLARPERLVDPSKGWGHDADHSRVELARFIDEALQKHRRAALLFEDGESARSTPWYERYGLEAPHLFVDGRLVVFTTAQQRPTRGQLRDLLSIGDSPVGVVGVVVTVKEGLEDLEEEDASADELFELVEEPLLFFAAAYAGEGFLTLATE